MWPGTFVFHEFFFNFLNFFGKLFLSFFIFGNMRFLGIFFWGLNKQELVMEFTMLQILSLLMEIRVFVFVFATLEQTFMGFCSLCFCFCFCF